MLLTLWWAFNKTTVRSDLSLFLPSGTNSVERLLLNELNEGPATRLLLLAIEGGSEDERVIASRQLQQQLNKSELFARVENGTPSLSAMSQKPLFKYRYLLSSIMDHDALIPERLKQALTDRLRELQSPVPSPFKPLLSADPIGAYQHLLRQWLPASRPHLMQGVWSSQDGNRTLLLAETHASGFVLDAQQQAIESIQDAFQASDNSDHLRLIISGPGAFGVQSQILIQHETLSLSLISCAGVMLLLLMAYRTKRYLVIAVVPLASAFLIGIFTTSLLFGELHGITLAFGITLLGVTIDYPLHIFSHLRKGESAISAVQRIWPTLRLGVITTCIGYLVLLTTDFTGLQQLGVFTLAGLFAAALSSRYILPLLIPHDRPITSLTGMKMLSSLHQPIPILSLLMPLIGLILAIPLALEPTSIWQDDIGTLTPLTADMIKRDRELRSQLRAPEANQLVVINGHDLETTLQIAEQLSELLQTLVTQGVIGGYDAASRYLPSIRTQQARRAAIPAREVVEKHLNTALVDLPFRKDGFTDFIASLEETRQLMPLTYADLANTPPGMRLIPLVRQQEEGWLLLTPLSQVTDGTAVADLLQKHLPSAEYLNLRTETSRLVAGFRHQITERLLMGVALMLLVLVVALKSMGYALKILLPVVLALLITTSLLHLMGVALNLFHLVSLMLVLGIGIDYSLFFGRSEDDNLEQIHTLHALAVCALSTSLVFGILGSSDIPVLQAIGQTVAIGVVINFLTSFTLARHKASVVQSS